MLSLSIIYMIGWGATDRTGEQSRYPRQVDLTYNRTTDCTCPSFYFLETNVGPEGQDPCEGDSGKTERFSRNKLTKLIWEIVKIEKKQCGIFSTRWITKSIS